MFNSIRNCILDALMPFFKPDMAVSCDDILLEQPKDKTFGDLYTNVAMMFAKKLGMAPKVLAEAVCKKLGENADVSDISIAGAGFINFRLNNKSWQKVVSDIIEQKGRYSFSNIFHNTPINLEFVSANPTGPLHTGHARNAVFGSVVANLLEHIGYKVTREFYINDQGNQIKFLARSVYLRYCEALGETVSENDFTSDMYCGDYIKDLAKGLIEEYGDLYLNKDETEWLDFFCRYSIDKMMENIKADLALLGVVMDKYTSEAGLCKRNLVNEALEILKKRGDIYEGALPRPKGITDSDEWEERPQTLFRSTKYGDDVDRAIRKADGTWTYFAGDLAYHLDKIQRGFFKMIAILGADHNGYVKRLKSAVSALSEGKASLEVRLYQLVNFLENGKPVRMSKRAGTFITLKEVVERVGKDVTRYMMISRHHDVMIDFDFIKAVEQSMENPLFYIQYAYARICSVFRHFEAENGTAIAIEPHRVPAYMQNIASLFHALWNKGKINTNLRFIDTSNRKDTVARLSLLMATKIILEDGFDIIGVTPMSEMR